MYGQGSTIAWWNDVIRMVGLAALTAVFLLIGVKAKAVVGLMDKFVEVPALRQEVSVDGVIASGFEWSPTATSELWELTESDLDYQRVVMNVTSKPGFRWLGLYAVTLMVGVGVVLSQTGRAVEAMMALVRRIREIRPEVGRIGAAMSGTVRITASTGVIYFSGFPKAVVGGMEEYASVFLGTPMAVVRVG